MSGREYDYLFKLVIIGDSGVGKSSLLLRFADDQFSDSYLTTIGVDFRFKTLPIDGKNIKLQIWDTAGQERFRTITNAYYKGADGIVIVYDTTSQQSFESLDKFWMNEVDQYAEKDVQLLLIGNKSDVVEQKQVDTEKIQEYAQNKNMLFYEASAKTASQVEDAFVQISKKLMAKRDAQLAEKKKQKKSKNQSGLDNSSFENSTQNSFQKNEKEEIPNQNKSHQPEKLVLNKPKKETQEQGNGMAACCKM